MVSVAGHTVNQYAILITSKNAAMIPILLYILYKKKGKNISRAAKKVLTKAKNGKLLKRVKLRRKPIRNAYNKFRYNRLNRKRVGN